MKKKGGKSKNSSLIRYGVYAARDKIPARIKREADHFRDRLISDVSGIEERCSGAQLILIDRAINIYAIVRKVELHVARAGPIDEGGKLRRVLSENYLAYCNSLRLTLKELGIKPGPEDLLSADAIIDEIKKRGGENDE